MYPTKWADLQKWTSGYCVAESGLGKLNCSTGSTSDKSKCSCARANVPLTKS